MLRLHTHKSKDTNLINILIREGMNMLAALIRLQPVSE